MAVATVKLIETGQEVQGKINISHPKILFVNGHWNKILNKLGMAPGEGGKDYWKFFINIKTFKMNADNYFNLLSTSEELFIDGSTLFGGDESGNERKERGYNYAKENFEKITENLGNNKIYLISHSEGGAFAVGVAKYLVEQGIKIGESIMLSTDEGDEFSIDYDYPAYQIVAGYIKKEIIGGKNIFIIDPVVKDNMVKGVTRYGVYISNAGFSTVHADTISFKIFDLLERLKAISMTPAWNSKGKIVYQTNPKDEVWAKIDETILNNKRVDLYPLLNSNIVEHYYERED